MRITELRDMFDYLKNVKTTNLANVLRREKVVVHNIKRISYIDESQVEQAIKLFEDMKYCKCCGTLIENKSGLQIKHCSSKCSNKYARKRFISGESKTRRKTIEAYAELASCSVECLLKEFGDYD